MSPQGGSAERATIGEGSYGSGEELPARGGRGRRTAGFKPLTRGARGTIASNAGPPVQRALDAAIPSHKDCSAPGSRTPMASATEWGGAASLLQPPEGELTESSGSCVPNFASNELNQQAQEDELLALRSIYGKEMSEPSGAEGPVFEFSIPLDLSPSLQLGAAAAAALSAIHPHIEGAHGQSPSLPPIKLRVRLVRDYPSHAPPLFSLRSCWLSDAQLEAIAARMDEMASDFAGEPVVCAWVEWLRADAADVAGLNGDDDAVVLLPGEERIVLSESPHDDGEASLGRRRAQRWPRDHNSVVAALKHHATAEEAKLWGSSLHRCGVCLDDHSSLDCLRLARCKHTFCRSCLRSYWESQMASGLSTALLCPEPTCRLASAPAEVKELMTESEYEEYERLTLETSLAQVRPHERVQAGPVMGRPYALCPLCSLQTMGWLAAPTPQ